MNIIYLLYLITIHFHSHMVINYTLVYVLYDYFIG